jgi:hypothetical protein
VPCVAPRFVPVTVTTSLMWPIAGVTDVSVGGGLTVNGWPLLA